ncbi:hypothetical protein PGN35_005490 [Nodosilinea sp. PGN35]|uniref:hypothetical protein n=1 Tax=Nodosilinea sp. PGN35 TaxID=3020489 RepID=UPI0023B33AAF|nr:hypothetical protein [Nodosilinea sp. TSF1-S3]MDF0367692.1 hypothetical protein [Nodosilinea sp. TSF1-S3]
MKEEFVEKVVSVDHLPNDPMAMPPPYWRSGGAIFHVIDALEALCELLQDLVRVHEETEEQLANFYDQFPEDDESEEGLEAFGEICSDLWDLEHKIKMKAEVAILMSAIEVEASINKFCVYNLHKDIAETIEKLSPGEKLVVASASVGQPNAKANSAYEAIRKLYLWRNAFAHGHCTDRPTNKTLRHNHLISPETYPGVPDTLIRMKNLVRGYLKVQEYLRSISLNSYTSSFSDEGRQIQDFLREIDIYHFEGSTDIYSIEIKNID